MAICDSLLGTSANVESVGVASVYVGISHCSSVLRSSSANLSIVCLLVTSGSIDLHGKVAVFCVSCISTKLCAWGEEDSGGHVL